MRQANHAITGGCSTTLYKYSNKWGAQGSQQILTSPIRRGGKAVTGPERVEYENVFMLLSHMCLWAEMKWIVDLLQARR
jgi:hypothetical protein